MPPTARRLVYPYICVQGTLSFINRTLTYINRTVSFINRTLYVALFVNKRRAAARHAADHAPAGLFIGCAICRKRHVAAQHAADRAPVELFIGCHL